MKSSLHEYRLKKSLEKMGGTESTLLNYPCFILNNTPVFVDGDDHFFEDAHQSGYLALKQQHLSKVRHINISQHDFEASGCSSIEEYIAKRTN